MTVDLSLECFVFPRRISTDNYLTSCTSRSFLSPKQPGLREERFSALGWRTKTLAGDSLFLPSLPPTHTTMPVTLGEVLGHVGLAVTEPVATAERMFAFPTKRPLPRATIFRLLE